MAVIHIENFLVAAVGFLFPKPCSGLSDDPVSVRACGSIKRAFLRIAIKAAILDDGRIIHIGVIQIHVSADTINRALGRILPDAIIALIGTFAGILRYPVGVGCELRVIHSLLESGDSRAVNADKVTGILHCLAESNGRFGYTGLGRGRLCFIIHVDRVFQLLALQDLQEALGICFSGSCSHAVLADKVICTDRHTGSLCTFIICFPLAVCIKTGIGAVSLDDGKLDTGLFYLCPVDGSLPMTDVDSFSRHVIFPPRFHGHGAAPRPPSIFPVPAGRGALHSPLVTDLHWTGRKR